MVKRFKDWLEQRPQLKRRLAFTLTNLLLGPFVACCIVCLVAPPLVLIFMIAYPVALFLGFVPALLHSGIMIGVYRYYDRKWLHFAVAGISGFACSAGFTWLITSDSHIKMESTLFFGALGIPAAIISALKTPLHARWVKPRRSADVADGPLPG